MVLLSINFLIVVIPMLWGLFVAFAEVFEWQSEKAVARPLFPKFGCDIYEDGPLKLRVWGAFKRGYWLALNWVVGLAMLGFVLWLTIQD